MLEQHEAELAAMQEVGQRRLREGTISFLIVGATLFGLVLAFAGGVGAFIAGLLSGLAVSRAWVAGRNERFVEDACKKYGVPRDSIAPDKYLID